MCDKYDSKKFGKIKLPDFIKAIESCDKIKLTRAQVYLLESILPVDEKGEISYIESSKFIAEVVKKFYIHSSKKLEWWIYILDDIKFSNPEWSPLNLSCFITIFSQNCFGFLKANMLHTKIPDLFFYQCPHFNFCWAW